MAITLRTITVDMAKAHLRVAWAAGDPREGDLEIKCAAAEAAILQFVSRNEPGKTSAEAWLTPETTPGPVQACVLIELGELWRYRGDDSDLASERQSRLDNNDQRDFAPAIIGLLRRYTDPVLA